jgi:hypothetical protein
MATAGETSMPDARMPNHESPKPESQRPRFCQRCHRSVDPLNPNARRNPTTRKWEHIDCRTSPRPRRSSDPQWKVP